MVESFKFQRGCSPLFGNRRAKNRVNSLKGRKRKNWNRSFVLHVLQRIIPEHARGCGSLCKDALNKSKGSCSTISKKVRSNPFSNSSQDTCLILRTSSK